MTDITRADIERMITDVENGGHFTIEHYLIGKVPLHIIETRKLLPILRLALEALAVRESMAELAERQVRKEVEGTIALVEDKP